MMNLKRKSRSPAEPKRRKKAMSKKTELIELEAKMLYIKHKIEWLESFIEGRITIKETQSGNHYPQVEDKVVELAKTILGELRGKLKQAKKQHGYMPFTEYMYAIIKALEKDKP